MNSFDFKKSSFFFKYISNILTLLVNLIAVIFLIISTSSFSILEYLKDFCCKKSFKVAFSLLIEKYEFIESKKFTKISFIDSWNLIYKKILILQIAYNFYLINQIHL